MTEIARRARSIHAQIGGIVVVSLLAGAVSGFATLLLLSRGSGRSDVAAESAEGLRTANLAVVMQQARAGTIELTASGGDVQAAACGAVPGTLLELVSAELIEAGDPQMQSAARVALPFGEYAALLLTTRSEHHSRLAMLAAGASTLIVMTTLLLVYVRRRLSRPLLHLISTLESPPQRAAALAGRGESRELRALTAAARRLHERTRLLRDEHVRLLAAISHDLRSPLARLRLRAERTDSNIRDGMLREIQRMGHMLDGTLEHLRQGDGGEPMQAVDLATLLTTVCAEFVDAGQDVSYEGPLRLPCVCQPQAVARAITNLLDNALRYGTCAVVNLHPSNAEAQIEVADDGPGISPAWHDKVFEPFFRLEGAAGGHGGGFGLGLSLVRAVVFRHGGSIELRERVPHGLIVRIVLPTGCVPQRGRM